MGDRGPKPNPDKMAVLSTRIRADTRKALEAAARKSGRTLSAEIEHRMRRSFHEDRDDRVLEAIQQLANKLGVQNGNEA